MLTVICQVLSPNAYCCVFCFVFFSGEGIRAKDKRKEKKSANFPIIFYFGCNQYKPNTKGEQTTIRWPTHFRFSLASTEDTRWYGSHLTVHDNSLEHYQSQCIKKVNKRPTPQALEGLYPSSDGWMTLKSEFNVKFEVAWVCMWIGRWGSGSLNR